MASRYVDMIERVGTAESRVHPTGDALVGAVADSYFKLLAVKDEYEVARLFSKRPAGVGQDFEAKLGGQFEPGFKTIFHFAPPFLARRGANGRPRKIAVGGWFSRLSRRRRTAMPDGFGRKRRRERVRAKADRATLVVARWRGTGQARDGTGQARPYGS